MDLLAASLPQTCIYIVEVSHIIAYRTTIGKPIFPDSSLSSREYKVSRMEVRRLLNSAKYYIISVVQNANGAPPNDS